MHSRIADEIESQQAAIEEQESKLDLLEQNVLDEAIHWRSAGGGYGSTMAIIGGITSTKIKK